MFARLFDGSFREAGEARVELHEDPAVVEAVLEHTYTGRVIVVVAVVVNKNNNHFWLLLKQQVQNKQTTMTLTTDRRNEK